MRTVAVIPARMASSRFPGKPLALICGMSMIEHVYRRAAMSPALDEVVVATCDREILRAVERFGGRAVMTSTVHRRGTDRVNEAAQRLAADVVVNIQGDEPMLDPRMPGLSVAPLKKDRSLPCVNLMAPIDDEAEFEDPNQIKVVTDLKGCALYMSRRAIPSSMHGDGPGPRNKQVCVIAFRRQTLQLFSRLKPTPLERAESIDMMRLIENGVRVKMVSSPFVTHSVDTKEDLRRVERAMAKDPVARRYLPTRSLR